MKEIKLISFLYLISVYILTGCSKETVQDESLVIDNHISLIAPNGERVYEDMGSFIEEVRMTVARRFGDDIPFKASIEYIDMPDGYFAIITYQLENGITSNYAVSNSVSVLSSTPADKVIVEGETKNTEVVISEDGKSAVTYYDSINNGPRTTYECNSASNCIPCKVEETIIFSSSFSPGGETIIRKCSEECSDCKMTVTTRI